MTSSLSSLLEFPRVVLCSLILGALLAFPAALGSGFAADDFVQLLILEERLHVDMKVEPEDLYNFIPGDVALVKEAMNRGPAPWFTDPELKGSFWRPLSARLIMLDHALFGLRPTGYKIHSALWYLLLIGAYGLLMARLLPSRLGGLSVLLFATWLGHREPVSWLAARYVLVTTTFGCLGLWAHIRWREDGWKPGIFLSLASYTLSVLGGEAAIGNFGYLFAYELIGGKGKLSTRLAACVPAGLVVASWLATYHGLGYGTRGCGAYVNPFQHPGEYLGAAGPRLLFLVGSLFYGLPSHFWFIDAAEHPFLMQMGALSLAVVVWLSWAAFRRADRPTARTVAWLSAGCAIALLPQVAATLAPRSQTTPSLGAAVLVAFLIRWGWATWRNRRLEKPGWNIKARWVSWTLLCIVHLILNPLQWVLFDRGQRAHEANTERLIRESGLHRDDLGDTVVVGVVGADSLISVYYPFRRVMEGLTHPRAWWTLSSASSPHQLTRTSDRAFELEVLKGTMIRSAFDNFFRSPKTPFHVGDEVHLRGMDVYVVSVKGELPTRVRFTLGEPLESPRYRFIDSRLQPVEMPPVGGTIRVE